VLPAIRSGSFVTEYIGESLKNDEEILSAIKNREVLSQF
jgi:hypothetical protein